MHCSSLLELSDGDLLAVWYGGTEEGMSDVWLYQSVWDRETGNWSRPHPITDAARTQKELGIFVRKLGNAVLLKDAGGKLWLFYVTVSTGGWSGSAINYKTSGDAGRHWTPAKRLVTSPFLNMGTLVKAPPLLYSDGTIGLPVYHEMFGKYGALLHLSHTGSVLDMSRMNGNRASLQPSVVPLGPERAIAFLRNSRGPSRLIQRADTADGGRSWSAARSLSLPNPDSPVAGLHARDGSLLLVFNNIEVDRDNLALAKSTDGGTTWEMLYLFEDAYGEGVTGFSYPALIQADDGVFHLLYTWNRERIKHVSFNQSWLRGL